MSHLSKIELQTIRSALQAQHDSLAKQLRNDLEERGSTQFSEVLGRTSGDSSDEALAVTLGDMSAARLDHEIRHFRALEAALARLGDEDFGECTDCGASIPVQRLVANPAATRCVDCQELHEKTYATPGHGTL